MFSLLQLQKKHWTTRFPLALPQRWLSTDVQGKTLNLPKTGFPLYSDTRTREPKLLKTDIYEWQRTQNGPLFVLHDGPPYANGSPHIGHALNKILKDIIIRYKMLQGYKISYIPGWDCHGLPIELKVIEDMKKLKKDWSPSPQEIRKHARAYAVEQINTQKKEFMKWGVMGDWKNYYTTMDPAYEVEQLGIFLKMFKRGLIYRGTKPVYWSPSSMTALAEAELEYKDDHESLSIYVLFPVLSLIGDTHKEILSNFPNLSFLIWTTTPWTIPANKALCIHSNLDYCVIKYKENHMVIAKERITQLSEVLGITLPDLVTVKGSDLIGIKCKHPLFSQECPIFHGDHVGSESGTGIVHTAPGHGHDDYNVCIRHGIAPFAPVDDKGVFTQQAGTRFEGKFVMKEGNEEVLAALQETGHLLISTKYKHRYPYDWRTKKPIIVRSTKQWFANLAEIKSDAINAINEKNVEISPSSGYERLATMVEARTDWCISRQRQWGVPIPVFYHKDTGQELITDETILHIQELVRKHPHGTDCWWEYTVSQLLPPNLRNQHEYYIKGIDTMDVWFDSGVSWAAVINAHGLPKADIYLEGSDQYRGWFQSSLLTSVAAVGCAPYKKIITHGFVMDGDGYKMSKSLGNVIEPSIIIDGGKVGHKILPGYGVDVLRLWVASSDYSYDINVSPELLEEYSNHAKKIRNTVRYILGNLNDYVGGSIEYSDLLEVDKYMLNLLAEFGTIINEYYHDYSFNKGRRGYSLKFGEKYESDLYVVVKTIYSVFTKSLAPIMPHIVEDIHQYNPIDMENKPSSLFQTQWYNISPQWFDDVIYKRWTKLRDVKSHFNKLYDHLKKVDPEIRSTLDIDLTIHVEKNGDLHKTLSHLGTFAVELFIVSNLNWQTVDLLDNLNKETGYILELQKSTKEKCPRCWKKVLSKENIFCWKKYCPKVV